MLKLVPILFVLLFVVNCTNKEPAITHTNTWQDSFYQVPGKDYAQQSKFADAIVALSQAENLEILGANAEKFLYEVSYYYPDAMAAAWKLGLYDNGTWARADELWVEADDYWLTTLKPSFVAGMLTVDKYPMLPKSPKYVILERMINMQGAVSLISHQDKKFQQGAFQCTSEYYQCMDRYDVVSCSFSYVTCLAERIIPGAARGD